ncbi:MAG: tRNA (N(6)-L-threonylcarbamoyladenosine(37)-C(2))-methylthiotransferase MtaB [Bacillota bacterium]|nr:tRNA (N(6)-L-threonylcarbamoyladenosine(37)-C(2))-methylthiotransferase MtaB [Bacillota bacterium]MDW7678602.1 tRNA (N(6)-L-threonylcarbamoyladenosine(37)-C(2))-methylthiotransferase MtaB [Bacillota bacterium]
MANQSEMTVCELHLSRDAFQMTYGRRKKLATITLGCKVNQYETQALIELFEQEGYETVSVDEPTDVFLINTCTVTSMSDRKSRQMIRRARKLNPRAVVAVTGCYAQLSPDEVQQIEGVHVVSGTSDRHRLVDAVQAVRPDQESPILLVTPHEAGESFESLSVNKTREMTRAYVKIQDGCNQFCSYCIIPYARGAIRSRPKDEVVNEVKRLVANGFQEVVITGIHLASYGKEWQQPLALISLMESLDSISGLGRLRLGSLEPTLMQKDVVERIMTLNTLCHHFHLSLQSGCDRTLKAMNRRYTTEDYWLAVENIRRWAPHAAITTDVIVGFPGESEEDFQQTFDFVKKVAFADVHVFRYSPREGTPAARYREQVSESVKSRRSDQLIQAVAHMKHQYLMRFYQQKVEVLIEQKCQTNPGWMEGHTPHYIKVLIPYDAALLHRRVTVEIRQIESACCRGIPVA